MLGGRVWEQSDQRRRPLRKALVTVTPEGRGDDRAMTRSDIEGRWAVAGPLAGRYRVSASRPGYFIVEADGVAASSVLVDCTGACGPLDFVLQRGGAVFGVVEDDQGQPLENTVVSLQPLDAGQPELSSEPAGFRPGLGFGRGGVGRFRGGSPRGREDRTNDRGEFRTVGWPPGRYRLTARHNGRSGSTRYELTRAPVLELSAGQEAEIRLTLQRQARQGATVSGVVEGVDYGNTARRVLFAQQAGGDDRAPRLRGQRRVASVDETGKFELTGLAPGRYYFSTLRYAKRSSPRTTPLGALEVGGDMSGVTLRPAAAVRVAGRFEIDSRRPEAIGVRAALEALDGAPGTDLRALGSDPGFSQGGLYPGRYRVSARSPLYFLVGVRAGGREVDPDAIPITADLDDLVIVLSDRFARIEGRIRPPDPRYTVTLSSDDERDVLSTDQHGGFVFERVPPGQYTLCAKLTGSQRSSPCTIERSFPVEADALIELELNAP